MVTFDVRTPTEVFTAIADRYNEYPAIRLEHNGQLAAAIEHCLGDETGRVMIRVYSDVNDEPISIT